MIKEYIVNKHKQLEESMKGVTSDICRVMEKVLEQRALAERRAIE